MALDFPNPNDTNPWTGDNGVVYKYIGTYPNGYWTGHNVEETSDQLDARYVQVAGDNMTGPGDLTFDTDKIVLGIDGTAEFAGLTTHKGVSLSGGSSEVDTGLGRDGNNLILYANRIQGALISPSGSIHFGTGSGNSADKVRANNNASDAATITCFKGVTTGLAGNANIDGYSHYISSSQNHTVVRHFHSVNQGLSGTVTNQYGFNANSNLSHTSTNNAATNNYGFFSELIASDVAGKNNYNFFAAGSAPNYFKGDINNGNGGLNFDFADPTSHTFTSITQYGSIYNKFLSGTAGLAGLNIRKLGSTIVGTSVDSIARFSYQDQSPGDSVIYDIKMDGSGGIVLEYTSDYRSKENIVDLPSAVDAIKALRPVNYNYTWAPGRTRPGFVAHEIQETLPVAVTGTKDATEAIGTLSDYDGTVLETEIAEPSAEELEYTEEVETDGVSTMVTRTRTWTPTGTRPVYQSVDQTKLIPLLTKALQEALTEIDSLKQRLDDAGIA